MCFRYFGEALDAWLIHNEGGDTMGNYKSQAWTIHWIEGVDLWKPDLVLPRSKLFEVLFVMRVLPNLQGQWGLAIFSHKKHPCSSRRRRSKSPSCGSTTREVITTNTRASCYGRSWTYTKKVPHVPDKDRWSSNQCYLGKKYLLHSFLVYRVNIVYVASWHD